MNSFGRLFRITVYGESHGSGVGVVIDGIPVGMGLKEDDFKQDLKRRKSGKSGTTTRLEKDIPSIISGVFNGFTTGAPINVFYENKNIDSTEYERIKDTPRPGHSDFVANKKYGGFNDYRGGGHFSGRLTLGLVSAGVIAKKILKGVEIKAKISERNTKKIIERIKKAEKYGDSIGAEIECRVNGLPVGLGEPFFDSVESNISHLIFAIPGIKGIEFGDGFGIVKKTGNEANDLIVDINGKTATNSSGGINGGITNGNELILRVAVKPTSSIAMSQRTVNMKSGKIEDLTIKGRHDICFALRVPVIVESVVAIVLADFFLINKVYGE